jgi:hypothetical protein
MTNPIAFLDLDAAFCPPCSIGLAGQDWADHAEMVSMGALVPIYNVLDLVPDNRTCYQCSRPLGATAAALADVRAVVARIAGPDFAERIGESGDDPDLPF